MEEKIKIWLVGNTGLRNPNRKVLQYTPSLHLSESCTAGIMRSAL